MRSRNWQFPKISASEEVLQEWHRKAISGDTAAREKLMLWVYCEANRYYGRKAGELAQLTMQDAEDLASQFILEFESVWRDVRSVGRYTRFVLKRNLERHLAGAGRRARHVSLHVVETSVLSVSQSHASWMTLSDRDYRAYHIVCDEFFGLPVPLKLVIAARLRQPPTPYSVVCEPLGMDEATARVRTSRFFDRVRKRCGIDT